MGHDELGHMMRAAQHGDLEALRMLQRFDPIAAAQIYDRMQSREDFMRDRMGERMILRDAQRAADFDEIARDPNNKHGPLSLDECKVLAGVAVEPPYDRRVLLLEN